MIEIAANIACSFEAPAAFEKGAEGIGLFRTEMLFMDRSEAPDEDEQFGYYREALEVAAGKPVIIRTMDIGGDKPIDYLNLPQENNPLPRLPCGTHLSRVPRSVPHSAAGNFTGCRARQCQDYDPDDPEY